jgi:hypothetical protein
MSKKDLWIVGSLAFNCNKWNNSIQLLDFIHETYTEAWWEENMMNWGNCSIKSSQYFEQEEKEVVKLTKVCGLKAHF